MIGDGDDVGWTSPADASTPHGRHTGLRRVLRKDNPGADRKGGARYTAADAVCAERLRAGDGAAGGGDEDLRGGDSRAGVRCDERVGPYGSHPDEGERGGGVGSSERPAK